jgi:ABC-type oligopeptide transport system substrate-binding subunit
MLKKDDANRKNRRRQKNKTKAKVNTNKNENVIFDPYDISSYFAFPLNLPEESKQIFREGIQRIIDRNQKK